MLKFLAHLTRVQVQYVLKVDDDTYVNIPLMLASIKDVEDEVHDKGKQFMLGRLYNDVGPIR